MWLRFHKIRALAPFFTACINTEWINSWSKVLVYIYINLWHFSKDDNRFICGDTKGNSELCTIMLLVLKGLDLIIA